MGQADGCVQHDACDTDDSDDKADGLTCLNASHVYEQEDEVSNDGCHNCRACREQGVDICADSNADTGSAEQRLNKIAEACEEACASAECLLGVGCGACGAGDSGRKLCEHECEGDVEQNCDAHCDESADKVGLAEDVVPAVVAAGNNCTDGDCPYTGCGQGFFKFVVFQLVGPPYYPFLLSIVTAVQAAYITFLPCNRQLPGGWCGSRRQRRTSSQTEQSPW